MLIGKTPTPRKAKSFPRAEIAALVGGAIFGAIAATGVAVAAPERAAGATLEASAERHCEWIARPGTRFRSKVCLTVEDWELLKIQAQESLGQAQRDGLMARTSDQRH